MHDKACVINCLNNLSSKIHKFLLRNISTIDITSRDGKICVNTVDFLPKLAFNSIVVFVCLVDFGNHLKL